MSSYNCIRYTFRSSGGPCVHYIIILFSSYTVCCAMLSTRKSYYYRYNIVEVRVGEALCVFVVYLFNPHAFLSSTLSHTHPRRIIHLTSELTIYSIMLSKVYWYNMRNARIVYLGHSGQCRLVRRIMLCYSCVHYVVCVYYFFF